MKTIKAIAPAKINLLLKVEPLIEGQSFHNVTNIMQTISLHDTLLTKITSGSNKDADYYFAAKNIKYSIKLKMIGSFGDTLDIHPKNNLVVKAIERTILSNLQECDLHFDIEIEKNIPAQAGLAGGSSDCAAMLVILEEAFEEVSKTSINKIASSLGADVPFLIKGGCREMTGSGTIPSKKMKSLQNPIILVKPQSGISTRECFTLFDKLNTYKENLSSPSETKNDLQISACHLNPEIKDVLSFLNDRCGNSLMSGSGSCCFSFIDSHFDARKIVCEAQLNGWWSRICSCVDISARIVDSNI